MAVQVDANDELYRRILSYHAVREGDGFRISSAAFMTKSRRPDPHCSVYLARLTIPAAVLEGGIANQRLAGLPASKPMAMGLDVKNDDKPGDPAHCVILGLSSKQQCEELASAAYLIEMPDHPRPENSSAQ